MRVATEPGRCLVSAALGSVVTHAHPSAMDASLVVAEAIAQILCDPSVLDDRQAFLAGLSRWSASENLRFRIEAEVGGQTVEKGALMRGSTATDALLDAFAAFFVTDDPVEAMVGALNAGGDTDIVTALVGGLVGAAHGASVFPDAWRRPLADLHLVRQTAAALCGARHDAASSVNSAPTDGARLRGPAAARRPASPTARRAAVGGRAAKTTTSGRRGSAAGAVNGPTRRGAAGAAPGPGVAGGSGDASHLWFLLDRSGSMQSLRRSVVDGFNQFLGERKSGLDLAEARITVAQFDSGDPYAVLVDADRSEGSRRDGATSTNRAGRRRCTTPSARSWTQPTRASPVAP